MGRNQIVNIGLRQRKSRYVPKAARLTELQSTTVALDPFKYYYQDNKTVYQPAEKPL
jgi:hypothetical protein